MTDIPVITTKSGFYTELEKFTIAHDFQMDEINRTDSIDHNTASSLLNQALNLQAAAFSILPANKDKKQIVIHLAWAIADIQSWINLFSKKETVQ